MIKIEPKIFMITFLFCLCQDFSGTTSLILIQNFGNYSFVYICWTVYCLRIHSFENYWVVLSKYQKTTSSLPFILCWCKHIFLMIIQTFTEKHLSSNFWTANPLNMVDISFLLFWEVYVLITHCTPINKPKHQMRLNGVELCQMIYFSFNRLKIADVSKYITWKVVKRIIFENSNIIAFQ